MIYRTLGGTFRHHASGGLLINIRDIECILAIARHQSITKAAAELFLSQPALSLSLKKIEERLGLELFQRVGKRFVLNDAGRLVAGEGLKITLLHRRLEDELRELVNSDRGELRVGLTQLRGIKLLPAVLPVFRAAYPNVRLSIEEADADVLDKQLLSGDLDIGLYNQPAGDAELRHVPIYPEELVLYAAKNHPLRLRAVEREGCRHPWVDIRDCAGEEFIMNYPTQKTFQVAMQLFRQAGVEPRIVLRLRSLLARMSVCATGNALCFGSEYFSRHTFSGVEVAVYSIGDPCTIMHFVASHRRDARLSKYARKFMEICRATYGK